MDLSADEKHVLDTFCARVRETFGARVHRLSLFGSRARGDSGPESDIDVCVVVDDLEWQEKHVIYGFAGDLLTETGVLISAFILPTSRLRDLAARERRIAQEIEADGVTL